MTIALMAEVAGELAIIENGENTPYRYSRQAAASTAKVDGNFFAVNASGILTNVPRIYN